MKKSKFTSAFRRTAAACSIGLALGSVAFSASAQDAGKWWPIDVLDVSSGENVLTAYSPVEGASQPWNVCVLFPHMKDSFWVAVAYGIVTEAQRQGINMTIYEAGGYENLPRQLSQFDDCMASGVDAIVVGPISEAGLSKKFDEALAAGIPVIATVNPVAEANVTAKMFAAFDEMGEVTGNSFLEQLDGAPANVVAFPGPAGSGWAEATLEGLERSTKGSNVVILDRMFGDTGVGVQLQLVQDALQAYPEITAIWGSAPTAEAAIGAVAEIGREGDIKIISSYENQAMLDAMNAGEILGFATQYPVLEGKVAIDMAVRSLQGEPVMEFARPALSMITKETAASINMDLVLAPTDWTPLYSVSAP